MNMEKNVYYVYTRRFCIYCDQVKELLSERKKPFTVIDCDNMIDNDRTSFLNMMDFLTAPRVHRTFPYVFKGDMFIGGFDDTKQYEDEHALCFTEDDF